MIAWISAAMWLLVGGAMAIAGLLHLGTGMGQLAVGVGFWLVVLGAAIAALQLVERRIRRDPPVPRLEDLDGRPALHLPRAPGPTVVASWTSAGLGVAAAYGAVLTAAAGAWEWCLPLAALAAWALSSCGVHRGGSLAGGLWFTPAGMRAEHGGVRVDLPWDAVVAVQARQPMPVLVRRDHEPAVTRTGPRGRRGRAVTRDNRLLVDVRHLPGGPVLAWSIIDMAIHDPETRAVLGTEGSLPPPDVLARMAVRGSDVMSP